VLDAAEAGGRLGSVIEILVLQSLVSHAQGGVARALDYLERALALAEPEGYLRVFVDEAEPMRRLLRHAVAAGIGGSYALQVLSAFDAPASGLALPTALPTAGPTTGPTGLARPLTARELEILRLIAAGMRNQEIAGALAISPATVKRHIANAYGKLDARHRIQAVARAAELRLL
jgi:LuxR family maltose regulon positive regulatory protein